MDKNADQRVSSRPPNYNLWVGVFCVGAVIVTGLFYYATQKIEYTWRWNRVPIYFAYKDTIDIVSEIEGEVDSITKSGDEAFITVKGIDELESYTVPAEGLGVVDGEYISLGDTLATYTEWKPGLLVIGLWITLKLSIIATIAGIIIGIIGGIARLSSNPALKWTSIVYVEIIRGSPLMVQILIWYFVFGTVINDLLATSGLGRLPSFWYGVASLACFAGAYVTEIVRAGIQSIHRGQTEAA
jgi:polar amino acid transport system permease protein